MSQFLPFAFYGIALFWLSLISNNSRITLIPHILCHISLLKKTWRVAGDPELLALLVLKHFDTPKVIGIAVP